MNDKKMEAINGLRARLNRGIDDGYSEWDRGAANQRRGRQHAGALMPSGDRWGHGMAMDEVRS